MLPSSHGNGQAIGDVVHDLNLPAVDTGIHRSLGA